MRNSIIEIIPSHVPRSRLGELNCLVMASVAVDGINQQRSEEQAMVKLWNNTRRGFPKLWPGLLSNLKPNLSECFFFLI